MNNYFVLFYIAYLRQIESPALGLVAKHCDQSCLGELQLQMAIVFTGKTFGLQIVELAKPFVIRKLKIMVELLQLKKMMKLVEPPLDLVVKGTTELSKVMLTEEQEREFGLDEESVQEQKRLEAKEAKRQEYAESQGTIDKSLMTDTYELQSHMVNYEEKGTFDDFNEVCHRNNRP